MTRKRPADGIDMMQRVNLPVAVPHYVRIAFDKKVPKNKRSKVIASLVARYCGIVDPELRKAELKRSRVL